jgi:hypothetical protein
MGHTQKQRPAAHALSRATLIVPQPQLFNLIEVDFNGMITNDKFCCTRWAMLVLSTFRPTLPSRGMSPPPDWLPMPPRVLA